MEVDIIKNKQKISITVPRKQAPPSFAIWFCNILNMNTEIKTNSNSTAPYFDISMIDEAGFQHTLEALGALESIFEPYFEECWQDMREKDNGLPLFNNKAVKRLFKRETKTESIVAFMNNRFSQNLTHFGTKINELTNNWFNSAGLERGLKSPPTAYKQLITKGLGWQVLRIRFMLENEMKIKADENIPQIPNKVWELMRVFNDSVFDCQALIDKCSKNGFLYVSSIYESKIKALAETFMIRDKLQSKKPKWGHKATLRLRNYFNDKSKDWIFDSNSKDELVQHFNYLFDFNFLIKKAKKCGVKYQCNDQELQEQREQENG